ncbi:MAG: cytochrome C oxidase subunit IV family protein [Opitutales bacterium]|nr:cytochrome C oxidase subunit IV family protein [Opitutales bacterium]
MDASQNTSNSVDHHLAEEHQKYFTFFNVSIALIMLTAIELVIVYVPIHPGIVMGSLVVMSLIKFLAVIWWFMHLRWDMILCTLVFLSGLIIATGTVIALMLLFSEDPSGAPMI